VTSSVGTVNAAGVYVAPTTMPSSSTVTVPSARSESRSAILAAVSSSTAGSSLKMPPGLLPVTIAQVCVHPLDRELLQVLDGATLADLVAAPDALASQPLTLSAKGSPGLPPAPGPP